MHVSKSPGARPGGAGVGQLTEPTLLSATVSVVRSTLPVFSTRYEYWICSPVVIGLVSPLAALANFCSETAGTAGVAGTVMLAGEDAGLWVPWVSVPVAVAVSVTPPLSTSTCVTGCGSSAAQVSESPGASPGAAGAGQVTLPADGSETATEVRVTLPVFVTLYAYEIRSPTWTASWSAAGSTVAVLVSDTAGAAAAAGTVTVDAPEGSLCAPCVSTPVAVAESLTPPASTSDWTTV